MKFYKKEVASPNCIADWLIIAATFVLVVIALVVK